MRAVDVGGVEEGDPGSDGMVDKLDHVRLGLGRAVEGRHAHTAVALRGNLQPLRAQLDAGHGQGSGSHGSCRKWKAGGTAGAGSWCVRLTVTERLGAL